VYEQKVEAMVWREGIPVGKVRSVDRIPLHPRASARSDAASRVQEVRPMAMAQPHQPTPRGIRKSPALQGELACLSKSRSRNSPRV
jgi:hypothetical protein